MIQTDNSKQTIDQRKLLAYLSHMAAYPFACWKMPGESSIQLCVGLQKPYRLESGILEAPAGFIVNKFWDNHPISPRIIPADVLVTDKGDFTSHNGRSDFEIEQFLRFVEASSSDNGTPPASRKDKSNETVTTPDTHSFQKSVSKAVSTIKNAQLEKVVLSRFEDIELPNNFDVVAFFQRLTASYPNAFCNIWSLGDGKVWVGASPETLISQDGNHFQTISLAGTQPLLDQSIKDISWKQKEIEEQALVSRYIINCFKKLRVREFEERGPKTVAAGTLAHLISSYAVNTGQINFPNLADAMLELLHPTSAVCGMPIEQASEFIRTHEDYDREYYAGFIGPVNINERSHLFVNLRCMKFTGDVARAFAGAGITEDSDPTKEYEETTLKMEIMKSKLKPDT